MRQLRCLLLRRLLPLIAVGGLLVLASGAMAALGAGPVPDAPPAAGLRPDPVPGPTVAHARSTATTPVTSAPRAVTAAAPAAVTRPAPAGPTTQTSTTHKPTTHKPTTHKPTTQRRRVAPLRIVDVEPRFVDVPRGLGDLAQTLHDDAPAALVAIALVAAACAAASGAGLALVWSRNGGGLA